MRIIVGALVVAISMVVIGGDFEKDFVNAAYERTKHTVTYDGSYLSIPYPDGDVPDHVGVCTDVIIRAYRNLGTDLQRLVHEDIKSNFESYPSYRIWGLTEPDTNIDHRRVPNLQSFFSRNGETLEISRDAKNYKPGNLVTWLLPGNLPHIGIVTDTINPSSGNPMIVHNIDSGPVLEDVLFRFTISGHYRFVPSKYEVSHANR